MTKAKTSLNILFRIIEDNNRLPLKKTWINKGKLLKQTESQNIGFKEQKSHIPTFFTNEPRGVGVYMILVMSRLIELCYQVPVYLHLNKVQIREK